jgi:hypothetical protein
MALEVDLPVAEVLVVLASSVNEEVLREEGT